MYDKIASYNVGVAMVIGYQIWISNVFIYIPAAIIYQIKNNNQQQRYEKHRAHIIWKIN